MKIIESEFEILGETPSDILPAMQRIELAGRTAYQSGNKITDDSAVKFCKMLFKREHVSVLEHSNLTIVRKSFLPHKFPDEYQLPYHLIKQQEGNIYVSGNYRAWLEIGNLPIGIENIIRSFLSPLTGEHAYRNFRSIYSITQCPPQEYKRITVKFKVPRGVTHEMARHRARIAITQESTRFVKYKDLHVICPSGLDDFQKIIFKESMLNAEKAYSALLSTGIRAEIARAVLPIALKAEIVLTADLLEWDWIFKLRCSPAAHPEMRAIMLKVQQAFNKEGWLL